MSFLALVSCVKEDFIQQNGGMTGKGIQIIGAAEDFDIKTVGTRADGDVADSHITEMTMFIFKSDGSLIQGYSDVETKTPVSSAINIQKANPTFLIDTQEGKLESLGESSKSTVYYKNKNTETDLTSCSIYIVANAWHQLESKLNDITSLATLNAVLLNVDNTLDMPKNEAGEYRGFPMIGTHDSNVTFNLTQGGTNSHSVATIPLKKLYSKVRFSLQVNSEQIVQGGQTPKFELEKVEVFNIPTKVRMGYTTADYTITAAGSTVITDSNIGDYYHYASTVTPSVPFVINDFAKKVISHSSSSTTDDVIEFGFYMPEHMVTPNTITYPSNITDDVKQYYKPKGVAAANNGDGTTSNAKIAPYIRIHGTYTDHNGQIKTVKYDIYLGQNNSDDFEVKRNQQLNNYVIITGLTNRKNAYGEDQTNISVDHRVEVEDKGYNLSMEREAILDAHFEVRPLDIELQPGASMTVVIPNSYSDGTNTITQDWLAMESDVTAQNANGTENAGLYVNVTDKRKGVRKYFTTDLVSTLNTSLSDGNNNRVITVSHSGTSTTTEIHRIWFYIDENPNVYDKTGTGAQTGEEGYTVSTTQYRLGKVNFYYAASGTPDTSAKPEATINFQQWNLWRVWNSDGTRYYDIEHEEEYLNNYASDQSYGETQDGMPWGLEGLQLSEKVQSFAYNSGITTDSGIVKIIVEIVEAIVNGSIVNKPFYDFYNTKAEAESCGLEGTEDEYFPYNGKNFCEKIITKANAENKTELRIDNLTLVDSPKSAIEYCYNKNKRNGNGTVVTMNWYLPAIDEIQEITTGAYDEFDGVFQKNFYWSSQPAYKMANWKYTGALATYTGKLYYDNVNYARATRTIVDATGNFTYEPSGMIATNETWTLYGKENNGSIFDNSDDYYPNPTKEWDNSECKYDLGYKSRTNEADWCRIRAVYRSGTGTKTGN